MQWTEEMITNLPTLSQGSIGEHVKRVQGLLLSHGLTLQITGGFEAETDSCVKAFQHMVGLNSEGVVGPKTWRALIGG